MAATDTYLIKTAVFTPSGGSAINLTSLEEVTFRHNGNVVAHRTDATVAISAHFIDDLDGEVGVTLRNFSHAANANLTPGIVGALVITYQKRAKGKGATSGADRTITAAQAMVGAIDGSLPQSDRSTLTIPFHCSDDSGANPFAFAGPA